MARVVLIEDDSDIRSLVARSLAGAGYDVESSATALAGVEMIVDTDPDIVVLDLALPDMDGSDVLRMIRAVNDVPIIVATARDDEGAIVELLNAGADDYVVKPYSTEQLHARLQAVLRRVGRDNSPSTLRVAGLVIDLQGRVVTLDGKDIELRPKEFDLLALLCAHAGEVITKRRMLAEVWREPYGGSERTVDVHLSWLRNKLGETAREPRYLHTVRGVGVKLAPPG